MQRLGAGAGSSWSSPPQPLPAPPVPLPPPSPGNRRRFLEAFPPPQPRESREPRDRGLPTTTRGEWGRAGHDQDHDHEEEEDDEEEEGDDDDADADEMACTPLPPPLQPPPRATTDPTHRTGESRQAINRPATVSSAAPRGPVSCDDRHGDSGWKQPPRLRFLVS
jgi:hypothetical protein